MGELTIPEQLATTSVAWEGDAAREWLARLPRLVSELTAAWDLDLEEPYLPGGKISWVAPARRRSDGADLVLKVQLPHPESEPEAIALAAWAGRGAVRLEARDTGRRAILIERCDPGTPMVDEADTDAALDAGAQIAAVLQGARIPSGIPSLASVMAVWADELEGRRGLLPEVPGEVIDIALGTMRRTGEVADAVLLHGDLNPTNVLRSERGWLAIDPKPMAGDPAFDGARIVLQLPPEEAADPVAEFGDRIDRMAAALGVPSERVAAWCVTDLVERAASSVATGAAVESQRVVGALPWVLPHLS